MSIYVPSNRAAPSVKQMLQERRQEPEEPEEGRAGPAPRVADAVTAQQTSCAVSSSLPRYRGLIFSSTYGIFTNFDLTSTHNEYFNKSYKQNSMNNL